jgi:hypothetical protein
MLSDDRIPEGVVSPVLDEHCSFCNYIEGQGSEIPCKMPGSDFHENESWQPRRIYLLLGEINTKPDKYDILTVN